MQESCPFADTLTRDDFDGGPVDQCIVDYLDETGIQQRVFACGKRRNEVECSARASNDEGIISVHGVCQALNDNTNAMHWIL